MILLTDLVLSSDLYFFPAIIHKMSETNSSFHVNHRTTGKV